MELSHDGPLSTSTGTGALRVLADFERRLAHAPVIGKQRMGVVGRQAFEHDTTRIEEVRRPSRRPEYGGARRAARRGAVQLRPRSVTAGGDPTVVIHQAGQRHYGVDEVHSRAKGADRFLQELLARWACALSATSQCRDEGRRMR